MRLTAFIAPLSSKHSWPSITLCAAAEIRSVKRCNFWACHTNWTQLFFFFFYSHQLHPPAQQHNLPHTILVVRTAKILWHSTDKILLPRCSLETKTLKTTESKLKHTFHMWVLEYCETHLKLPMWRKINNVWNIRITVKDMLHFYYMVFLSRKKKAPLTSAPVHISIKITRYVCCKNMLAI